MTIVETPLFCIVNATDNSCQYVNEYTLRQLQLDIARKQIPHNLYWIDDCGTVVEFTENGRLSEEIEDLKLADSLALELFMTI